MSFLAPDHPDYDATYGDAIDAYVEGDDPCADCCPCCQPCPDCPFLEEQAS